MPVTTTAYWPVAMPELAEIVRVDVPDIVTLVGLRVAVRPDGDVTVRVAVPANPCMLVTVTVEAVVAPWAMLSDEGLLLRLKRNWL